MFSRSFRSTLTTFAAIILLPAMLSDTAQAQDRPPLAPDRPGLGEGTSIVGANTVQAEFGYALNVQGTTSALEVGQLLLRYGLSENLELRGNVNSYVVGEGADGYTGTGVGAKWQLHRSNVSQLSLVATVGLPTGTGPFERADNRVRQALLLAFDGALGSGLAFSATGGANFYYTGDAQTQWVFIPTLTTSLNERSGLYVGYGGFYGEGDSENWVEAGLTYLISPDAQLDVNTGLQLDENSDQFFVGLGLAYRF